MSNQGKVTPFIYANHSLYFILASSRNNNPYKYVTLTKPYFMYFTRIHQKLFTVVIWLLALCLLFRFPTDKRTWEIDTQFMWAHAFLIAPVVEQVDILYFER